MTLCRIRIASLFFLLSLLPAGAQSPESYRGILTPRVRSATLSPAEHLKDYVVDGKLSLSLRDAVLLALQNSSSIRIEETQVEAQKFAVLSAHQPFDPLFQSRGSFNNQSSIGNSQLQGVGSSTSGTLTTKIEALQTTYSQTFVTGTNINASFNLDRNATNSSSSSLNPYYDTIGNVTVTQPLLRNAGRFVTTAGLLVARRNLQQSRAVFVTQLSGDILNVVNQYWQVVQARGNLDVQGKSLKLAEASFQKDNRSLELGALPPLDIYLSQSVVASRRLQSIQIEYALKQIEEPLRRSIGAYQDPAFAAIELVLTEKPEPVGDLETVDMADALKKALDGRPEIAVANYVLATSATNLRLAHNNLKPDLSVTGYYQSNGTGGNRYDPITGLLITPGGLGSSFSQLFGFGYTGYGGSINLNLPIRNRGAQAVLGNALVSRRNALYSAQQDREDITRGVSDAVHQLDEAKLTLAAGKAALDLAQKSLAADQRKYELGTITNFVVFASQDKLSQAELGLLQTQISYQLARATVGYAMGGLLEPYHVQIDELSK